MSRTPIWVGRTLVLAVTLLLTSVGSDTAMARGGGRGGGGHGGGFHGGGFRGGYGGYRGGWGRGYGRGFYGRGYYGRGWGWGGWGYPYYGYGYGGYSPYYGSYGSAYPYYGASTYPYYYDDSAPYASGATNYFDVVPPTPQYTSTASPTPTGDNKAHLVIQVPDPNAQVKVNGQKTDSSGTVRTFQSPDLSPGTYTYDVQATWKENGKNVTESHTVKVEPGAESMVIFTPSAQ